MSDIHVPNVPLANLEDVDDISGTTPMEATTPIAAAAATASAHIDYLTAGTMINDTSKKFSSTTRNNNFTSNGHGNGNFGNMGNLADQQKSSAIGISNGNPESLEDCLNDLNSTTNTTTTNSNSSNTNTTAGYSSRSTSCLSAPSTPRRSRPNSINQNSRSQSRSRGSPANSTDMDNFNEGGSDFNGSLEDLVSNFDEKITSCFKNLEVKTEQIAPVQVRTQEEIMSESQVWWTLTGNFGNIMPIDWSKTQARKLQLPALNLRPKEDADTTPNGADGGGGNVTLNGNYADLLEGEGGSDEEELAAALDLHSLILNSPTSTLANGDIPQTADQVIQEIDEIMQGSSTTGCSSDFTMDSIDSIYSPLKSPPPMPLLNAVAHDPDIQAKVREAATLASDQQKLRELPYQKLDSLANEMESLIQAYNESLVAELALKDELEYEKELKNQFISYLLAIQNKRRQFVASMKRPGRPSVGGGGDQSNQPQFLTTVIPYQPSNGPLDNQSLQALIKILCPSSAETPTSLPIC